MRRAVARAAVFTARLPALRSLHAASAAAAKAAAPAVAPKKKKGAKRCMMKRNLCADDCSAARRRRSRARNRAHGPGGCHRRQHPKGACELSSVWWQLRTAFLRRLRRERATRSCLPTTPAQPGYLRWRTRAPRCLSCSAAARTGLVPRRSVSARGCACCECSEEPRLRPPTPPRARSEQPWLVRQAVRARAS